MILGFCYSDLTCETGGFELASTITLVLEANRLTKCVGLCGCGNYATVDHKDMQIFNFVVLSVIIAPRNVLTPHISKTHLFTINLIYVNSS